MIFKHPDFSIISSRALKNKALSQKRADAVLKYASEITDPVVGENSKFIKDEFKAVGKASSELVYNADGTENYELSRRVEFRIETNPNK